MLVNIFFTKSMYIYVYIHFLHSEFLLRYFIDHNTREEKRVKRVQR